MVIYRRLGTRSIFITGVCVGRRYRRVPEVVVFRLSFDGVIMKFVVGVVFVNVCNVGGEKIIIRKG